MSDNIDMPEVIQLSDDSSTAPFIEAIEDDREIIDVDEEDDNVAPLPRDPT